VQVKVVAQWVLLVA